MPLAHGGRVLLTTAEAGQQSGLSQRHICLLLNQHRIEGFKLGPIWHVYADSLETFVSHPRKPGPKGPRRTPNAASVAR